MPDNSYLHFLQDPDQAARRQELVTFFGPRPEKYLKVYDAQVATANRPAGTRPALQLFGGFCWPAFFLGPIWMFYRKMWVYAAIAVVLYFIVAFLPIPSGVNIGLSVGIAAAGARLYVWHAMTTVTRLRGNPAQIASAGGVSLLAGCTAGILYVLVVGYFAVHMARYRQTQLGSSPPSSLTQPFPR